MFLYKGDVTVHAQARDVYFSYLARMIYENEEDWCCVELFSTEIMMTFNNRDMKTGAPVRHLERGAWPHTEKCLFRSYNPYVSRCLARRYLSFTKISYVRPGDRVYLQLYLF